MTIRAFLQRKQNWLYCFASCLLFLLPLARIVYIKAKHGLFLLDLAAYSDVSLALFKGRNPFPDHVDLLTIMPPQTNVPIVYPGQMLLFAVPGFLWGNAIQIGYLVLNMAIIFFLTGLTLVKACGYEWNDLWRPGRKQFFYALCCFCFFSSTNALITMRVGQIPVILALCLYGMFWGPPLRFLRTFLFAFAAVTKYSILPVFAPMLFFKGHWKLCIAAFSLFILFSVSPVFCGNDLKEVYVGYFESLSPLFQPGQVNHFDRSPLMCHLGFFRITWINTCLKVVCIGSALWLFWRERKSRYLSDTLLLLAFSLTMLISYHSTQDISIYFPLFFIRLFAFFKEKKWWHFSITALFVLFLIVPGGLFMKISAAIGGIPGAGSFIILADMPYGQPHHHVFPLMPFYTIALTFWSLYLYLYVKDPYLFEIPGCRVSSFCKDSTKATL